MNIRARNSNLSPKLKLLYGVIVVSIMVGVLIWIITPRDESPLPSPNADIVALMRLRNSTSPEDNTLKFSPRFYLVDSEGKFLVKKHDNVFFDGSYVSKTLQGAQTLVIVNSEIKDSGKWVTVWTNEERGPATSVRVEICCIDINKPTRRRVLNADAAPLNGVSKEPGKLTGEDGKIYRHGQWSPDALLEDLLKEVMQ